MLLPFTYAAIPCGQCFQSDCYISGLAPSLPQRSYGVVQRIMIGGERRADLSSSAAACPGNDTNQVLGVREGNAIDEEPLIIYTVVVRIHRINLKGERLPKAPY